MIAHDLPRALGDDGWRPVDVFVLDDTGAGWRPGLVRGELTLRRELCDAGLFLWTIRTRSSGYRIAWAEDLATLRKLIAAIAPLLDWYRAAIAGPTPAERQAVRDTVDRLAADLDAAQILGAEA